MNKETLSHWGLLRQKTKDTHNIYRPINPGFVNLTMPYLAHLELWASKRQVLLLEWS